MNGWAPAGLLDTYESERYPVGERVMMHSQAQLALRRPAPKSTRCESFSASWRQAGVATTCGLLAGSDVRYDVGDDHPLSGLMVPDLELDDGRRVAELLHDARPVLLDGSGGAASAVAAAWSGRVDAVAVGLADGPVAMLIRPDGYVAWAADTFGRRPTLRWPSALRASRSTRSRSVV